MSNIARIVIYVEGGIVQEVLFNRPGIEVMVVDYDKENDGDLLEDR